MNWKCSQCGAENAADDEFCLGCGTQKPAATATTTQIQEAPPQEAAASTTPATPPAQAGDVVRTLIFNDQPIPLSPGTFSIGRADSPANPNLKIDSQDVSGTPLVLTITSDGKVTAKYEAVEEKAYAVIKGVKPGQEMEVLPGEVIVAGASNMITIV